MSTAVPMMLGGISVVQAADVSQSLYTLSGRITASDGSPIVGARVVVTAAGFGYSGWNRPTTASDGTYSVSGLRYGPYDIEVVPPTDSRYVQSDTESVSVTGDQTFDTVLAAGARRISGSLNAPNGASIANALVSFVSDQGSRTYEAVTDPMGGYIVNVRPGYYTTAKVISFTGEAGAPPPSPYWRSTVIDSSVMIDVTENDATLFLKLNTGRLDINVQDAAGNPLSYIDVTITPQDPLGIRTSLLGGTDTAIFANADSQDSLNTVVTNTNFWGPGKATPWVMTGVTYLVCAQFDSSSDCQSVTPQGLMTSLTLSKPTGSSQAPANLVAVGQNYPTDRAPYPTDFATSRPPTLTWAAVADASAYNIYRNGQLLATTSAPSFTDQTARANVMLWYYVTAVINSTEGDRSSSISVMYDDAAPVGRRVYMNYPLLLSQTMGELTASFHDDMDGIARTEYYVDADPGLGSGTVMNQYIGLEVAAARFMPAGLSDGNHTVYVRAEDIAGNWSNLLSQSFSYDGTGPTLSNVVLSPTKFAQNTRVTISAKAIDFSGVSRVEYYVDIDPGQGNGSTMPVMNGVASIKTRFNLSKGDHTLYVRALDGVGHWSSTVAVAFALV